MAIHVVKEAQRCLQCKRPMCVEGCPVSTPIPDMIKLFLEGKSDEAGNTLFTNNPLSVVCALVCNHEAQCEGHCVQARRGMAIHWSSIEQYISDRYLDRAELHSAEKNHVKVAIIGSGPAGLTISVILAQRGYDITLFETRDKIGGVLRYGIPDFRLPKTILERYQKKLESLGVKIRPNTTIGGAITVDDLIRDDYKAVFIGTGVWRPHALGIKGETLGNVHYALNYLVDPDVYKLGEKVAIIGAGNAAMDVARTVIRHGARDVTVFERSQTVKAGEREVDYARADGVQFRTAVGVSEIREEGPVIHQLAYDDEGKLVSESEGELFEADSTIIAIGQGPKDKIVNTTEGIATSENGLVVTDGAGQTTHEGVFASGDVTSGAKTVVEAVKYSREVAEAMDAYLRQFVEA